MLYVKKRIYKQPPRNRSQLRENFKNLRFQKRITWYTARANFSTEFHYFAGFWRWSGTWHEIC